MSKKIASRVGVAAATLALATAGVLTGAGTASAGTNGQQISYTDHSGGYRHSIEIYGYNEYGQETLGCFNINAGGTTNISWWWWRGDTTVKAYSSWNCQNNYSWGTHVNVPYSQPGDWTYVTGY